MCFQARLETCLVRMFRLACAGMALLQSREGDDRPWASS